MHFCIVSGMTHVLKWPLCLTVEYVNAQELPTDMRSITDRAATTLLWTELFRGHTYYDFHTERLCHAKENRSCDIVFFIIIIVVTVH